MLTYISIKSPDIALVQETPLSRTESNKSKRNWVGRVINESYTRERRLLREAIERHIPEKKAV